MRYLNLQLIVLLLLTVSTTHAQAPVSADEFSQRGISRFEKNDLEGAIADFTKAIELKGHQLEFCFYFRGIALYRLGRLDDALADLSKAINLKQHPRFYDDRGNLLAQKGDFDGALVDLNRAIEIDPKYARAYGDRGIVRLMRGDDADAELDFKKCFELANIAPAGGINSSARDMAQWLRLMISGGVFEGKRLVSEQGFYELVPKQVNSLPGENYRLGWGTSLYKGHRILSHIGAIDGFGALVVFLPESKAGFAILANIEQASLTDSIMAIMLDYLISAH